MSFSKIVTVILFLFSLTLLGCSLVEQPEVPTVLPSAMPIQPTSLTENAETTAVPNPTQTAVPLDPTPGTAPTAENQPSPTPSRYPDIWISGLIWDVTDEGPTLFAGGNSVKLILDALISIEPANETVAADLAQFQRSSLVVVYGDYIPYGFREGHMIAERVEAVNLPYSQDTPLSQSYTDPTYGFTISYPDGWILKISEEDTLAINNRPAEGNLFYGPGIEYRDPTSITVIIKMKAMSRQEYVQSYLAAVPNQEDLPPETRMEVTVLERTINNQPVTQIDLNPVTYDILGTHLFTLVVPLDDQSCLVFRSNIDNLPLVERLISNISPALQN